MLSFVLTILAYILMSDVLIIINTISADIDCILVFLIISHIKFSKCRHSVHFVSYFLILYFTVTFSSITRFYKHIVKVRRELDFIKVGKLKRTVVYVLIWLSVSLKRILERMHGVEEVNHFSESFLNN